MDDVERTMPMRRITPPELPRRHRQGHIEPQLREPGGAGSGTPFVAFVPGGDSGGAEQHRDGEAVERSPAGGPGRRASAGARAATFRAAARREPRSRT